ncbi:hypothetical protein [Pseudomonas zeae]|uniref:Uncharacterized protein n=1 Tax=Pseudomonas zeae TaxID=2745510 RepID=A0ABU5BJZ3_9PSED|nr:hypothetical protein [Pseudomonas zeae]MDX9676991.1 hypothetical protein [Pseudomonas zeae]
MAIFLIIPINAPEMIERELERLQGLQSLDFIKLPTSGFAVSYSGTSQELSNITGISEGTTGTGVVAAISSYYGRAPTNIWDWIKSRWES